VQKVWRAASSKAKETQAKRRMGNGLKTEKDGNSHGPRRARRAQEKGQGLLSLKGRLGLSCTLLGGFRANPCESKKNWDTTAIRKKDGRLKKLWSACGKRGLAREQRFQDPKLWYGPGNWRSEEREGSWGLYQRKERPPTSDLEPRKLHIKLSGGDVKEEGRKRPIDRKCKVS